MQIPINKLFIVVPILLISTISYCQSNIDEVIASIEFKEDTIHSVFKWMTDNIAYDVSILTAADPQKRFKATKEARIENTLKSKKGVCQDYSEIIDTIVKRLGYHSFVVSGYTKNNKGNINGDIGHAWNAIKVDNTWMLYDATWAAGYVTDKKKFVKRYNATWYQTPPSEMIETHMPFDPIWQLTDKVITYRNFEKGTFDDFVSIEDIDVIRTAQTASDDRTKASSALSRSNELGTGHNLVRIWKGNMKKKLEYYDGNDDAGAFNAISNEMKSISNSYRSYIAAKNKRFKDKKWSKSYCLEFITDLQARTSVQLDNLSRIKPKQRDRQKSLKLSISKTRDLLKRLAAELTFINTKL